MELTFKPTFGFWRWTGVFFWQYFVLLYFLVLLFHISFLCRQVGLYFCHVLRRFFGICSRCAFWLFRTFYFNLINSTCTNEQFTHKNQQLKLMVRDIIRKKCAIFGTKLKITSWIYFKCWLETLQNDVSDPITYLVINKLYPPFTVP